MRSVPENLTMQRTVLVCRLGQIAKRLPPAICDLDVPNTPTYGTNYAE